MAEVQLTVADYMTVVNMLKSIGYSKVEKKHKSQDLFRLELQAPRKVNGSEVCYRYENNGYESRIWLSFLEKEQKFRDVGEDSIWAIIVDGDDLVYCARPFLRIKGFELRVARYAWVNKWKIDNIPLCPCEGCKAQMQIFRKKGTRQYMFVCKKTEKHPDGKFAFLPWDHNLPPKAQQFVEARRLVAAAYRLRNKKLGKQPVPKAVTRKRWVEGRPDNHIKGRQ